ncbi:serine protease [Ceratobasidium sp. 414]|nr:serine protease [Ceratobasidium sp. 414]
MITVAVTFTLLAASGLGSPLAASEARSHGPTALAPVLSSSSAFIPNQYIVVLKPEATAEDVHAHTMLVQQFHEAAPLTNSSGLIHVYDTVLKGYAGRFSDRTLDMIRALPEVEYVERDQVVHAIAEPVSAWDTQKDAPWGLARISHPSKLSFATLTKYIHDPKGGEGVDVYVIDTGINTAHTAFEGRAHWGVTTIPDDVDEDGNGHGTHCAGTIASKRFGVAKSANVYAVKVLNSAGKGATSDVIAGVAWASAAAQAKAIQAIKEYRATGQTSHKGSVVNMSLGSPGTSAVDQAVNNAVQNGLHVAVAAGNDHYDACYYSPARAELALTVGASTMGDEMADFSNYGPCVEVFAPGQNVMSTWIGGETATQSMSGTSMASPHAAGLLAYFLSLQGTPGFNPTFDAAIKTKVYQASSWTPVEAALKSTLPSWMYALVPARFKPTIQDASTIEGDDGFFDEAGMLDVTQFGSITPAQLKTALLRLALSDKLTGLPEQTYNRLLFNNATI